MFNTTQIEYETLRSRDSATFTGSYQTLGTPLEHPAVLVKMVNNSDVLVTISVDGTTDHDILPAGSFWLYDITSDSPHTSSIYRKQGTQFYVKGSASTGSVYLVSLYVKQIAQ